MARGRARRVQFEGASASHRASNLLARPADWRCPQDELHPLQRKRLEAGATAAADLPEEPLSTPPDVTVRFVSSDGSIVETDASTVWVSSIVRDMVSLDEEIPVPKSSASVVSIFVRLCELHPDLPDRNDTASLWNVSENELLELLWVAKLLDAYSILYKPAADMLRVREHLSYMLPVDFLYGMVRNVSNELEDGLLVSFFARLLSKSEPRVPPARVVGLIAPFMNSEKKEVREGALEALEGSDTLEANIALLQHRDYAARSNAIKYFRQCDPSEELVEALSSLAASNSFLIKVSMAKALKEVAPIGSRAAVDLFVSMLLDNSREVRREAADGLNIVAAPDDPHLARRLSEIVMDEAHGEPVRCDALNALAALAPDETATVEAAAVALQAGGSTMTRLNAAKVLGLLRQSDSPSDREASCTSSGAPTAAWADLDDGDDDDDDD